MAGILVYALHDDEGNFNKNSLGALSEASKLAGELGTDAAAVVVGEVADDAAAGLGADQDRGRRAVEEALAALLLGLANRLLHGLVVVAVVLAQRVSGEHLREQAQGRVGGLAVETHEEALDRVGELEHRLPRRQHGERPQLGVGPRRGGRPDAHQVLESLPGLAARHRYDRA